MIVYVLEKGEYSDRRPLGIFSSEEKAQAYWKEFTKQEDYYHDEHDIYPWEVDALAGMKCRRAWYATVYLVREPATRYKREYQPGEIVVHDEPHDTTDHPYLTSRIDWKSDTIIRVESFVSPEHAHKCAVEQWQAHLREVVK